MSQRCYLQVYSTIFKIVYADKFIPMIEFMYITFQSDKKIKGGQIGDPKIKQILPKTPPCFLRDINFLTRIQMISKL